MPAYDERLAALEKDAATMKRDIIYKLDETNSAVTIIKGVVGNISHDVRVINLLETRLSEHTTLLAQILARLPEKP